MFNENYQMWLVSWEIRVSNLWQKRRKIELCEASLSTFKEFDKCFKTFLDQLYLGRP